MEFFDLNAYLQGIFGKNLATQIRASFEERKALFVFRNSLLCEAFEFEKILQTRGIEFVKLNEEAYFIKMEQKPILTALKEFEAGHFYVLNFSSYLCAKALQIEPNDRVLDMCAAPGGKSIVLANAMKDSSLLSCVEKDKQRFFVLKKLLQKYEVKAHCYLKDSLMLGRICEGKFDKILLDAPCSSYSKMGFSLQKSNKELRQISKLQKRLLHSALFALKTGGELIYSTCTFLKEENEEVIENALQSQFELEIAPLNLPLNLREFSALSKDFEKLFTTFPKKLETLPIQSSDEALKNHALRLMPNAFYDGFFLCKLKKLG